MSDRRHDLPQPVRLLDESHYAELASIALGCRRIAAISTPSGPLFVEFITDSDRLDEWFAANWYEAPLGATPDATLRMGFKPAAAYHLDPAFDRARWWWPVAREMIVLGCESYAVAKVCVRGLCSAMGPSQVVFVHGCAFELTHDDVVRGILLIGSSGAGKTTLISMLRHSTDVRLRIVSDDWGAVGLADNTAMNTGELRLHMKARSVLALRPDFFDRAEAPMYEGSGGHQDPSLRVLVHPGLVFGSDALTDTTTITDVMIMVREPKTWTPPTDIEEVLDVLETGSFSAYYERHENFFNGALMLLDEESRRRERERYRRLVGGVNVVWLNNSGTTTVLLEKFFDGMGAL